MELGIKPSQAARLAVGGDYGFTDKEFDFPSSKLRTGIPSTTLRAGINYDIKYRMGRDAVSEEE
jgi:hypothetical protein